MFGVRKYILNIFESCCRLLPLQDKVIFDNFRGRGLGDDPKYVALELKKKCKRCRIIWLLTDMNIVLPEGFKKVKYGSALAVYHLCTAKVWVDNVKNAYRTKKRKGQYYIQTWHSTLGLKQNEANTHNLPEHYVCMAKKDAAITDLMYANNDVRYQLYKQKFWYHGEVKRMDVPRISILHDKSLVDKIRIKYNVTDQEKIVLYAPTLRNHSNTDVYVFNYRKCLEALQVRFKGNFIFFIRLHPGISTYVKRMNLPDFVVDVTEYSDMQELLAAADILVTDFSGSMFDFGYLRKPCFLYANDLHHYMSSDRKLQFSLDEIPFAMSTTDEDLVKQILQFDYSTYIANCNSFYDSIGYKDSGKGAEQLSKIIISKLAQK